MGKAKIRKVLDELDAMAAATWKSQDEWLKRNPDTDRPVVCKGVGLLGRCTDTAIWLADRLGGDVYGYRHDENPEAELGRSEFGHDFVVVDDRWLADWWAKDTYQLPDLYDLQDPNTKAQVHRLYGDPKRWEKASLKDLEDFKKSLGI